MRKGGFKMSIEQRVLTCRVLEKMKEQKGYSKKLGLENASTIHGQKMNCDLKTMIEKGT